MPISLNQTGEIILSFNSSAGVDFYLANATAFGQISAAKASNQSARGVALGLEGKGVYELCNQTTSGSFPYTNIENTTAPCYLQNVTAFQSGTYYALFANSGNATVQIGVTSMPVALTKLESSINSVGTYSIFAFLMFVCGIGLIVYSLISKGRQREEQAMDQEAAAEYARIEKHGKKKKS